jgi:hypothetical protein
MQDYEAAGGLSRDPTFAEAELVPAVGIEPTTNGLQIAFVPTWNFVNQMLAALANLKTGVIQSQLWHSQSGEDTSKRNGWLNLPLAQIRCDVMRPCGADAAFPLLHVCSRFDCLSRQLTAMSRLRPRCVIHSNDDATCPR